MGENLLDLKYVNRDGDTMRGPLALPGHPSLDAHAASKGYVDTLRATLRSEALLRDGSQAMTGPLTLAGLPTLPVHAASRQYVDALAAALATIAYVDAQDVIDRAYADAQDVILRAYVDAQDALLLPIDGSVAMTGLLTLSGDPLLALQAATRQYVDALPVGLPTYDAVVAAAGGDYTDIVTACATEAVGARIFVKSGTYAETANIVMQDGQMLFGENPENTIIDFGAANRKITSAGGLTNLAVRDLTIQNSIADYTVELVGDSARIVNCRILGTATGSGALLSGDYSVLQNCHFSGHSAAGAYCAQLTGDYDKAYGNQFNSSRKGLQAGGSFCEVALNGFLTFTDDQIDIGHDSQVLCNSFRGGTDCLINGDNIEFTGNYFLGTGDLRFDTAEDYCSIVGNMFEAGGIISTNVGVYMCSITGNVFRNGAGIQADGLGWTISGNTFGLVAFITLAAGAQRFSITGNNFANNTAAAQIVDNGTANLAKNNSYVPVTMEKDFRLMENTSGGALVAGNCCVLKAVAAGDEIDTTVNQGDDMVFGMLESNINNGSKGPIQTEGFTSKLKVNGTVAIGIGDFIGTHTNAGIGRQAAAGDMAFAIALEAYAGADDNGVIDALLIKPRKL